LLQKIIYIGILHLLGFELSVLHAQSEPEVKDADYNVYNTVKLGKQVWMAENLKTTKYNDGISIQLITDSASWTVFESEGYCWYGNNNKFKNPYGALYNWRTINSGKLCPAGWHIPAEAEWTALIKFLGDSTTASCKLKETGTKHWNAPNKGATNVTGFTALPGGGRNFIGSFANIGIQGSWWTSTEDTEGTAWCVDMYNNNCEFYKNHILVYKTMGLSVRCIKN
jgi:uncharacterized protein (TIGR02145 family)